MGLIPAVAAFSVFRLPPFPIRRGSVQDASEIQSNATRKIRGAWFRLRRGCARVTAFVVRGHETPKFLRFVQIPRCSTQTPTRSRNRSGFALCGQYSSACCQLTLSGNSHIMRARVLSFRVSVDANRGTPALCATHWTWRRWQKNIGLLRTVIY